MATFKDKNDRTWTIELDAHKIRQVRAGTCSVDGCRHRPGRDKDCESVDLVDENGSGYRLMAADPPLLIDVLLVLCREQLTTANVSDGDFMKALVGDPLDDAARALVEAGAYFFPKAKRELALATAKTTEELRTEATQRALAKIYDPELKKKLLDEMEARADAALNDILTQPISAMSSPDTSESAPAD